MSQPTPPPVTTPLRPDATIMKRLGYVKMLHQQAVEQSYATPPFNFSATLAFHDVMEYFFILAVANAGAGQHIDIRKAFADTVLILKAPDGSGVACIDALRRVAAGRNAFKHNGAIPGVEQVENDRRDATAFLEANCPKFFGVTFGEISMLHIVPQDAVCDLLKAGRTAADDGDVTTGMSKVALAFHHLMTGWGQGKGIDGDSFQRARFNLSEDYSSREPRLEIRPQARDSDTRSAMESLAYSANAELKNIAQELGALRYLMRIQLSGVDMSRYVRFAMLAPRVDIAYGGHVETMLGISTLHYTLANYEFCESFVVDSALRLDATNFDMWMPLNYGDVDRATEAAAQNGGVLPEGWS